MSVHYNIGGIFMETLKAIAMRKSTRGYKVEQISESELNKILDAALEAPCGMGKYETLHLTVIRNQDFLNRLTKSAATQFNAPELSLFFNAPTIIAVSSTDETATIQANTACVIENMAISATDLGLGSLLLWAAFRALRTDQELLKELNLPEGFIPQAGIAIGYPAEKLDETLVNKHNIEIKYFD